MSSAILSACMVGPNYHEPTKKIETHWLQTSPSKHSSVTEEAIREAKWWELFHDPTLTCLIQQGYQNNLSLMSAGVRVLQARAQLAQAVGQLYPQQQAMVGNITHQRIGGGELNSILPSSFDMASLGFSASWELDFWGKYRRAILSQDATFLASLAAYDNALVTLMADIGNAYINIRTTEELIRVTKENIFIQKDSLRIARSRYNAGEVGLLDVQQAQTELSRTEASLPTYIADLQKQKDILGVLLGTVPNDITFQLAKNKSYGIPKPPKQLEIGIPKEALGRRPDIHQARLEAIAQSEAIGAVKANLFPSLSLTGTFAFSSTNIGNSSLSDMFNWSNRTGSIGSSLTWPLFNYGQITNAVRAQDAVFQQALLKYVNLVLQAQQEVQDNITGYIEAKKSAQFLTQANTAAKESTRLAIIRYREGETDFTTVIDVERQQLQVQTELTKARGEISRFMIALYRSLGGGWQIRGPNDVVPGQIKAEMAARTDWGNLLVKQNHLPPATNSDLLKELFIPNW